MARDAAHGLNYLGLPHSPESALSVLTEPVRTWFRTNYPFPTRAQQLSWPALAKGENLLLSAPTGGGKTWAAFLPIMGRLLASPPQDSVRCLYVAPLKALVNDVRVNLEACVRALPIDGPLPDVGVRTGDTSAASRKLQKQKPPAFLLTTPESLAVMLSHAAAARFFERLEAVVVDEVHELAPSKRGADLAVSLERLAFLSQCPLQRIGLSATCQPLAEAAGYLVGNERPCSIAAVADPTPFRLRIEPLETEPGAPGFLAQLCRWIEAELATNRTILVFANVRGLAERIGWALRRRFPELAERIDVHHSSIAKERRRDVERRLKAGELRVVVSSASLELGIDIGSVDLVVLVHPPGAVVRLLQRIGRSGHGPGRPRSGLVLTANPSELLEAAVSGTASRSAQVEMLSTCSRPLDVLCQQLVGMAMAGAWTADQAFDLVRRAYPYRDLARADFDGCLDYLSGRKRDGEEWLPPRLHWVDRHFVIRDPQTARLLRRNLGTIVAEEPRAVRVRNGEDAWEVGQVDESYADRLQPGDRFLLGGRCLEFQSRDQGLVLVDEVVGRPLVPRWTSETAAMSAELAGRTYLMRARAGEALRDGPEVLARLLRWEYGLGLRAVAILRDHLERQERVSEIPDSAVLLVELAPTDEGVVYYVHTSLNRAGNEALGRVAGKRLLRNRGAVSELMAVDMGFALILKEPVLLAAEELRGLLDADNFSTDLRAALADRLALRDRFSRVAATGLMVLRNPLGEKRKVGGQNWAERRLFEQVRAADPECVLMLQAEREARTEHCDGERACAFAADLGRRFVRCRRLAEPSPFTEHWTEPPGGSRELAESPTDAFERWHASLTG